MAHTEEIEAWKQDFSQRLDAFMEKRAADIGNPARWRFNHINNNTKYPFIEFISTGEDSHSITFTISHRPEGLTAEERHALLVYVKELCTKKGFAVNRTYLPSHILNRVRHGDPEAWNAFAAKHYSRIERDAERLLGNGRNRSILEADDLANMGLARIFKRCKETGLRPEQKPQQLAHRALLDSALKQAKTKTLKRQSDGRDFGELVQPEYNGLPEMLKEQLPIVLSEAQKRMTPKQKEVLDVILKNEGEPLSLEAIGTALGCTGENVRIHMKKITQHIEEAALRLGPEYEQTAAYISGLTRINASAGPTRR